MVAIGVGEGHIANAECVEIAQQAQAVFDGMAALNADERRDFVLPLGLADFGGGAGE